MNVKHRLRLGALSAILLAAVIGCSEEGIVSPGTELDVFAVAGADVPQSFAAQENGRACWGQATRVFAATGMMGEHSSQFETPRLGLRNLARALHEEGVIEDDTMQALGAFVADELGLTIDACM